MPTESPTMPPPMIAKSYMSVRLRRVPRRLAAVPQFLEKSSIAHGVHALPELVVLEGDQLPLLRGGLQWFALKPRLITRNEIQDSRLEHEEAAVDPARLGLRLLSELCDQVAIEMHVTKP